MLLWASQPNLGWRRAVVFEAGALFAALFISGVLVFGGLFPSKVQDYPLEFLCIPPLI